MKPAVSISIVSHKQITLVTELLADIRDCCKDETVELILTLNLPEELPFSGNEFSFPLRVIRNRLPQGFGENHNQAFQQASADFFCVLNPDLRIKENIFKPLISALRKDDHVGLVAPQVVNLKGEIEYSARNFPAPGEILGKAFGRGSHRSPLEPGQIVFPDWVAGMFMLFPAPVFREIGGFDTRYFLYYEDVDLCARLMLRGYRVALCQDVTVIHNARRASHRSLEYLRWHTASMMRFFMSDAYRETRRRRDKNPG